VIGIEMVFENFENFGRVVANIAVESIVDWYSINSFIENLRCCQPFLYFEKGLGWNLYIEIIENVFESSMDSMIVFKMSKDPFQRESNHAI
jgi:hypothetical protein